jgi:hypothetical protein
MTSLLLVYYTRLYSFRWLMWNTNRSIGIAPLRFKTINQRYAVIYNMLGGRIGFEQYHN